MIGNQGLSPFLKKEIVINYSQFNNRLFNINSSTNIEQTQNSIQREVLVLNDNLFQNRSININKTLLGLTNNLFVSFKKMPKRLSFNFNHLLDIRQTTSRFNGLEIDGVSTSSILNLQAVYKKTPRLNIKNNFSFQYLSFNKFVLNQYNNRTNIDVEINKRTYCKVVSNLIFGNQVGSQPNLSFEIQRYFLKNNVCSLELKALNILQQETNNTISQSINQQFVNKNLQQPTMFLVKCNFYPERWKK